MSQAPANASAGPLQNGSLRLFRLFGVNVFVHWSWLFVAAYQINRNREHAGGAHPLLLSIAEYLTLFLIVLTHEYGHALACKSVGGIAERIVLWPLGGLAFVQPPERPGALLWSIAAGPLVNVVLLPLTIGPAIAAGVFTAHDSLASNFLFELALINIILLVFNMLPIYPLDGGQILRALLWFVVGRSVSLIVAAALGLIGAVALAILALVVGQVWLGIMVVFMGLQSFAALRAGIAIHKLESLPRHTHTACPACGNHPLAGPFWACACGARFDTFATGHRCPSCNAAFADTACPFCRTSSPATRWYGPGGFPVAASGNEEVI
jgi:Zn-dependent protease